jgi:hypothetical protein
MVTKTERHGPHVVATLAASTNVVRMNREALAGQTANLVQPVDICGALNRFH